MALDPTTSPTSPAAESAKALTVAAHAAFVPIGVVTVILGPLLPILSARWSLNDAQAGTLFTAQFVASTVAVSLSGLLVTRWGFRFAIMAGLLVMALSLAALPFASWLSGLACIAGYGVGLGLAVPACNLVVAEVNPQRRSAALNLLNFSWSVGSVACPFLVGAAAKLHRVPLLLEAVAVVLFAVLLGIAAMPARIVEPAASAPVADGKFSLAQLNLVSLLTMCAIFFLYVGMENAFGGWIASYAMHLDRSQSAMAIMTPSFFYFALMIGRWLAPLALRRVDEVQLARAGLIVACAGMTSLVLAHSMMGIAASAAMAGIGLSAVYPISISLLSRKFGRAAAKVGSIMFTVANLGGASLPWLVGYSSQRSGNLRFGLAVPLIAGLLMVLFYLTADFRENK